MILPAEGGGLPEEEGLGGGGGDQGQGDEGRRVCGAQPPPPTVPGPRSALLATRRSSPRTLLQGPAHHPGIGDLEMVFL